MNNFGQVTPELLSLILNPQAPTGNPAMPVGMGGLGIVPGMGLMPNMMGSAMSGIPGMEGTNKIPGQGLAEKNENFDKSIAIGGGEGGGNTMAYLMGMEALKQLSAPQKQTISAPSAGIAPRGGNIQLQMQEAVKPNLAAILYGGR